MLSPVPLFAQASESARIPVYISAADGTAAFTEPDKQRDKQRADVVVGLRDRLGEAPGIELVAERSAAVVIVEVVDYGLCCLPRKWFANVRMSAGDFSRVLNGRTTGTFGSLKKSAHKIAEQIDAWVEENRAKLLSLPR